MPTHTPATALAAVLNELLIFSGQPDRSAEAWQRDVQQLIDLVRPSSNLFLERERIARDTAQAATAIAAGAQVVYTNHLPDAPHGVLTLPASGDVAAMIAESDEPEQYYRRSADGTFEGPFTFTAEDGLPFTLEEDAMMHAEWERDHARRNNVA